MYVCPRTQWHRHPTFLRDRACFSPRRAAASPSRPPARPLSSADPRGAWPAQVDGTGRASTWTLRGESAPPDVSLSSDRGRAGLGWPDGIRERLLTSEGGENPSAQQTRDPG